LNFITNNTTSTEGGHGFTFSDNLDGTGHTLSEIYDALAGAVSASKVKLGTTYLGVTGTLVPSGGDAAIGDVLSGKTFFGDSQTDWGTKTGTMAFGPGGEQIPELQGPVGEMEEDIRNHMEIGGVIVGPGQESINLLPGIVERTCQNGRM